MKTYPYPINKRTAVRYEFESIGRRGSVLKAVEIVPLPIENYYNFGFGDVQNDGSIDDLSQTNNDDLLTIFATLYSILKDFLDENIGAKIFFAGSDEQRTTVYSYILKRNYVQINQVYIVSILVNREEGLFEILYDPDKQEKIFGFIFEKK